MSFRDAIRIGLWIGGGYMLGEVIRLVFPHTGERSDLLDGVFVALAFVVVFAFVVSLRQSKQPRQTCAVYCPGCKQDLVSARGIECCDKGDGSVEYNCNCGEWSRWLFETPVPLLLNHHKEGDDKP